MLFGSSWLQFGGWLLRNQPQDAALHRVNMFFPSGQCWNRKWSRLIVHSLIVDAGATQRICRLCVLCYGPMLSLVALAILT